MFKRPEGSTIPCHDVISWAGGGEKMRPSASTPAAPTPSSPPPLAARTLEKDKKTLLFFLQLEAGENKGTSRPAPALSHCDLLNFTEVVLKSAPHANFKYLFRNQPEFLTPPKEAPKVKQSTENIIKPQT